MDCNCKYIAVKTNKSQKVTITKKKSYHTFISVQRKQNVSNCYIRVVQEDRLYHWIHVVPSVPDLCLFLLPEAKRHCTMFIFYMYISCGNSIHTNLFFLMIIFMTFCKAASKCLYINTRSQPVAVCVLIANNVVSRNVLFSWTNFSP